MARTRDGRSYRIDLWLHEGKKPLLAKLKDQLNAPKVADVVRWSLAVYATLCEAQAQGATVLVRFPGGTEKEIPLTPPTDG